MSTTNHEETVRVPVSVTVAPEEVDTPVVDETATDAPVPAPVSAYDPGLTDGVPKVHDRIREDLAPVGKVVKIDGVVVPTIKHGIVMENVKVLVQPVRFRTPVAFSVAWDEDTSDLIYRTADGSVFTPRRDDDSKQDSTSRHYVDEFFEILDAHPVTREKWTGRDSEKVVTNFLWYFGVPVWLFFMAGLVPVEVSVILLVMMFFFVSISMLQVFSSSNDSAFDKWVRVNARRAQWNKNISTLLSSALEGTRGAVVMDALLDECSRAGVDYKGELGLLEYARRPLFVDDTVNPNDDSVANGNKVFDLPVLSFEGVRKNGYQKEWFYFDGVHIYQVEDDTTDGKSRLITL